MVASEPDSKRTEGVTARRRFAAAATLAAVALAPPLVGLRVEAGQQTARAPSGSMAHWSRAVTRICAHALLFEGRHELGTLAGAIAVSRDIRSSTRQRLANVAQLPRPNNRKAIDRWLGLERRLAAAYATSYLKIYEVIAATRTPRQHSQEPRLLGKLLHAPDRINWAATRLGALLHVPDCTGGTPRLQPSPAD
jgi:hypothetical protein